MDFTYSRIRKYKSCPKKYYFSEVEGIKPKITDEKLIVGSQVHYALERIYRGDSIVDIIGDVREKFLEVTDEMFDEEKDEQEFALIKIEELLKGYYDLVYPLDMEPNSDVVKALDIIDTEAEFSFKFEDIGGVEHNFKGKIDMLARTNGLWIVEHKTTAQWSDNNNLKLDEQGTSYMLAAESSPQLDYDVKGVLYNIIRKPSIRLRKNETLDEYRKRLYGDIRERPDFYYIREFSTRSYNQIKEFYDELRYISHQLHKKSESEKPIYYRNPAYMSFGQCNIMCDYTDLCIEYDEQLVEELYERKEQNEELEQEVSDVFKI